MKKWLIVLLMFPLILGLVGCFAKSISKTMDSWVGCHQSELIATWGPPNRTASDGKGGTILIYEFHRDLGQSEGRARTDAYGNVTYTYPQKREYSAARMFYVNTDGIIYHWRWQGL